jgi:hypothetical protein
MICVLFLVSLATLEYILRHEKASRGLADESRHPAADTTAIGLLALGRAVDECGRGQDPGDASEPPPPQSTGTDGNCTDAGAASIRL